MAKTKPKKNGAVEKKLVGLGRYGHRGGRSAPRIPPLAIPIRALSNVSFNERKGMIEMGEQETSPFILQRRHGEKVHADDAGRGCPV